MENKSKLRKAKHLLILAQSELNKYKSHYKFANLSQACEKTWVAFTLMLEYMSKKEIKTSNEIKQVSIQLGEELLYNQARYLHVIHYEGSPSLEEHTIIEDVQDTIKRVEAM